MKFYWYPKCGTCRNAKKWLDEHNISYEPIHIVESPPSKAELKEAYEKSGLPLKKFFNTSGQKYRELGLKDKVATASEDELLELLSSDGMLIKRPLAIQDNTVAVGFKEEEYSQKWQ
ncbi:arsenate reductase family protein [Domibacillus indicus]|uniref:arsenate reductase family protein n=1 Tax=Domibacillus indicus TaxID=1437523 RepID=UPI000617E66E|nr:arsenate reductase family protein [Domibacillus indicus]